MLKLNENYFFIERIISDEENGYYYMIHYGKLVNLIPKYDMKLAMHTSNKFGGRDSYAIFECEYAEDKKYAIRINSSESLKYFGTVNQCIEYCSHDLGLPPKNIGLGLSVLWYF